jgi:hypothetical protein
MSNTVTRRQLRMGCGEPLGPAPCPAAPVRPAPPAVPEKAASGKPRREDDQ